jgi:polyadenylate-binding protein
MCVFHQKGRCRNGDKCTFLHEQPLAGPAQGQQPPKSGAAQGPGRPSSNRTGKVASGPTGQAATDTVCNPALTRLLAHATPDQQKQILGELLYVQVKAMQPEVAGKITGMLLEMDNADLLLLLDSKKKLVAKVDEAIQVLKDAGLWTINYGFMPKSDA